MVYNQRAGGGPMLRNADKCVICGAYAVEGHMMCWNCEHEDMVERDGLPETEMSKPIVGKIIAVDFDGTLCVDRFPEIGVPIIAAINWIKNVGKCNKIILWTCRVNDRLSEAIDWCKGHGITFDAINDNLPENVAQYGTNPRKVFADLYIDDKSISGMRRVSDIVAARNITNRRVSTND